MADRDLSNAIRGVLNTYAATNALIDRCIRGSLREADIAQNLPHSVTTMRLKKVEFAAALDQALTALGAVWQNPTYNLAGLGLSPGIRLVATEELSAIRTYAPTAGYDAAKALTNMLRLIKTIERGRV